MPTYETKRRGHPYRFEGADLGELLDRTVAYAAREHWVDDIEVYEVLDIGNGIKSVRTTPEKKTQGITLFLGKRGWSLDRPTEPLAEIRLCKAYNSSPDLSFPEDVVWRWHVSRYSFSGPHDGVEESAFVAMAKVQKTLAAKEAQHKAHMENIERMRWCRCT